MHPKMLCAVAFVWALHSVSALGQDEKLLLGRVTLKGPDGTNAHASGAHVVLQRLLPAHRVDQEGWVSMWLPGEFPLGETVILRVRHEGFAMLAPAGGELLLPSDLKDFAATIELLPKGAPQLLHPLAMEKLGETIARRSKEQIPLAARSARIDFSRYYREWAEDHGFKPEQVKAELDKWIAAPDNRKADSSKAALSEFLKKNFDKAAKLAADSAVNHEKRLSPGAADADTRRTLAVRDHRLTGDAHFAQMRFAEAARAYTSALAHFSTDRPSLQSAALQIDLVTALLQWATRAPPDEAKSLTTDALKALRAAEASCPIEALCWEPGQAAALRLGGLKLHYYGAGAPGAAVTLTEMAAALDTAGDARLRSRILDDMRARDGGERMQEGEAWRRYALQAFTDLVDLAPNANSATEEQALWKSMFARTERDYGDQLRLIEPDNDRILTLLQRLEPIYQDVLFDFARAYEMNAARLKRSPDDLAATAEFAEKHFTTANYNAVLQMTTQLLSSPDYVDGIKCALRALRIAAMVGLREVEPAAEEARKLVQFISAQPADFQTGWVFLGTRHFIQHHPDFAYSKGPLLTLLFALERDSRDAILKDLTSVDLDFSWVPDSPG